MIVSDKYRLILICNPKVASRSMRDCLFKSGIGTEPGVWENHHKPAFAVKARNPDKWDRYLVAGFCRNPYDRIVSIYHDHHNLRGTIHTDFKTWLSTIKHPLPETGPWSILQPQHWYLGENGGSEKLAVNYLGKYESLQEDWKTMLIIARLSGELEMTHVSGHNNYLEYYDSETAKIVEDLYAADFELFGYRTI